MKEKKYFTKNASRVRVVKAEYSRPRLPAPLEMDDLVSATSGAVASCCSELCVFPLNSIKIKAQAAIGKDSSPMEVARRCLAEEGVVGFYRGLPVRLLQQSLTKFVMFYTKSAVLLEWRSRFGALAPFQQLMVGMLAEVPNTIFLMPLDTVCNLVVKSKVMPPPTMGDVAAKVHREHGLGGFWRGWAFSLLLCSNPAIQFSGFDIIKDLYLQRGSSNTAKSLSWGEAFAIGAIAKAVATVVTFPAIRFKILLQTAKKQKKESTQHERPGSSSSGGGNAVTRMLKREGLGGLYKGVLPQLIKGVLASALLLGIKEKISHLIARLLRAIQSSKAKLLKV
jgi:hypothetical protein